MTISQLKKKTGSELNKVNMIAPELINMLGLAYIKLLDAERAEEASPSNTSDEAFEEFLIVARTVAREAALLNLKDAPDGK